MRRFLGIPVAAVMLTACVTINVYFPAAEAKEAAEEFVEKVIGDEARDKATDEAKPADGGGMALHQDAAPDRLAHLMAHVDLLSLVGIGAAHAQSQPDITIKT